MESDFEERPRTTADEAGFEATDPVADEALPATDALRPEEAEPAPEPEPVAEVEPTPEEAEPTSEPEPVAEVEPTPEEVEPTPEAEEPEEAEEPVSAVRGPGGWYVIHTYSGYENKVKTNLHQRIASMQMEDKIFDVVIPMEDV